MCPQGPSITEADDLHLEPQTPLVPMAKNNSVYSSSLRQNYVPVNIFIKAEKPEWWELERAFDFPLVDLVFENKL